jgi:hypothetical protein
LFCGCMGLLVGYWSWVKMLKNPNFETNALFLTFVKSSCLVASGEHF